MPQGTPAGRGAGGSEVLFQVKDVFLMLPFEQRSAGPEPWVVLVHRLFWDFLKPPALSTQYILPGGLSS